MTTIAVLTLTPVARDGRVVRSAQALAEAGYVTTVIGREPFPVGAAFSCVSIGDVPGLLQQRTELVACNAPATILPALAAPLYWAGTGRRSALREATRVAADIVLCNDWNTLPVGAELKRRLGAQLIYDSHEYAAREHVQNWKWRLVSRRAVTTLERRYINCADLVLTVSEGIADALQRDYRLACKPTVVRNLPPFATVKRDRVNPRLQVLFHGLIRPERGLEQLIDSARSWTFDGEIVLRGYGNSRYLDALRARARAVRADLLSIDPPVPPDELIALAGSADIGFLGLPATTDHYEYALPNKLFEYLMAGLPVLATPRGEIRRVIETTRAGLFTELRPEAIARALNNLGAKDMASMRNAALAAAVSLNWEAESAKLVDAVGRLRRRNRTED